MRRLAIFGASGHGRVVADTARAAGWQEVAFFDDRWPGAVTVGASEVAGNLAALIESLTSFAGAAVAIGDCRIRHEKYQLLKDAGAQLPVIVHPFSYVSPSAELAPGTVIMAGAVVQPGAQIGAASIVNTCASVDHDCRLGDSVHVAPGAHLAGEVRIGDRTWVGLNAAVRQGIRVGKDVLIAAGAVVVKDHGDGGTLVGCPARPLR